MTSKRFSRVTAIAVCLLLGLAGMSQAVDSSSPYHVSKWESIAASTTMYSVFSDYYYVNSSQYTWRTFNSNCFYFARWVTNRLRNVDFNLQTSGMRAIELYGGHVKGVGSLQGRSVSEIAKLLGQHLNDVSGTPSEQQVRNIFANAQVGDVIQFVGWSSAGQHTMIIAAKYDNGFDTLEANNPANTVRNNYLSYADFRNRIAAAGSRGGFSVYHFGTDPIPPYPPIPDPDINAGLLKLTSGRYAKTFTLTDGRYYNLYTDSSLKTRLSSSAWTGENDEDYITGVGKNSDGVVYAQISYPNSSGRRITAYVKLSEVFVKGTVNNGVIKATQNCYGLYKRANSGHMWSYGIDVGDECYLLTEENGWYQVLYPISGRSYYRIAWMTEGQYNATFPLYDDVIPPTITNTGGLPAQVVAGTTFSTAVTATGTNPITWSTSAGTPPSNQSYYRTGLPSGLSISGSGTTGTISGRVSHTDAGRNSYYPLFYYFKIKATNAGGSSPEKQSYIVVYEPPEFTTFPILEIAEVGKNYEQSITAKGTEKTMRWSISGSLPPGLKFMASNNKRTATITGTPTVAGTYTFTVKLYNLVGNSNTTTTRKFVITVTRPNIITPTEYADSRISLNWNFVGARAGTNYSDWTGIKDSSSGTKSLNNYIFTVESGTLPPGLSIVERSASGYNVGKVYLEGVPTTSGTYDFTLKAKRISDGGYNTRKYRIYVAAGSSSVWRNPSMSLQYTFAQGRMVQVPYRDFIYVRGGSSPYTASVVSGTLPQGLRLEQSGNYLYLTGTPKRDGTFTFTLRVTGRNNGYAQGTYSVSIAKNPYYKSGSSSSTSKPKFISKQLPDANAGSEWEATLDASGREPIMWTAVGDLPDWMTLDEETGRISGIPTEPGKYKFKVKAENEIGSVTKTFKVKVIKAAPTIVTATLPIGYTGVAYEARLEAFGTAPIKWSKIGKFPSGLKLNKTEGIIYGTPKKSVDSFDITVRAKNKGGYEIATLKITIKKTDDFDESTKDDEEFDGNDDENDNDNETTTESQSTHQTVSATPDTPSENHSLGNILTGLYVLSGDERLEGTVNVEARKSLAFEIGQWQDEYGRNIDVSDITVLVNDEAVSADVSDDGLFTLPAENVSGEFVVYVSAQYGGREIRTSEINAIAGEIAGEYDGTILASSLEAGNEGSNSDSSSSGGCSAGVLGVVGLMLAGMFVSGKKFS